MKIFIIQGTVIYLASKAGSYVTAAELYVDGGTTLIANGLNKLTPWSRCFWVRKLMLLAGKVLRLLVVAQKAPFASLPFMWELPKSCKLIPILISSAFALLNIHDNNFRTRITEYVIRFFWDTLSLQLLNIYAESPTSRTRIMIFPVSVALSWREIFSFLLCFDQLLSRRTTMYSY